MWRWMSGMVLCSVALLVGCGGGYDREWPASVEGELVVGEPSPLVVRFEEPLFDESYYNDDPRDTDICVHEAPGPDASSDARWDDGIGRASIPDTSDGVEVDPTLSGAVEAAEILDDNSVRIELLIASAPEGDNVEIVVRRSSVDPHSGGEVDWGAVHVEAQTSR